VLWGRSVIQAAEDESLEFKKFHALPENMQVRDLTYEDLEAFGVPVWRSGTFRYISDATAGELDALISESGETLSDLSEESWALEGRALLKRHVTKERSAKLIKAFKAQLTDFACSVCGFSFEQIYGAVGAGFIEAHHVVPIATLTANTKMSISDLVPVCSNCHRMLHRDNPPLSLKALKEVMAEQ
jgi:predicted HNH restriction endonuclease